MTYEEVLIATPSHITSTSTEQSPPLAQEQAHPQVQPVTEPLSPPADSSHHSSRKATTKADTTAMVDVQNANHSDGDEPSGSTANSKKGTGKSRRELPAGAVATLKAWLLSPEHFTHPYPTPQDQVMLMNKTGIDKKQLKNWFTNARRRIWKPMLKKQLESGNLQKTTSGGVVAMPGATPGLITTPIVGTDYGATGAMMDHNVHNVGVGVQNTYSQVMQQQQPQSAQAQAQTYDQFGNPTYIQQKQQPQQQQQPPANSYGNSSPYDQNQVQYNQNNSLAGVNSNSIGSLPNIGSTSNFNKTDSHAVLTELFARDQELVRQLTKERANPNLPNGDQPQEGSGSVSGSLNQQLRDQHPMGSKMAGGSSTFNKLGSVSSMNSWPHFSSVSSLNNISAMAGVKSITNMSGIDLAKEGSFNKKGNLAQVKSIENLGRADSFAFLELFFENPNGGSSQMQSGTKRDREEDDNIGLSLDADEGTSPAEKIPRTTVDTIKSAAGAPVAAPLPADGQDKEGLKRAYDDALAARGLISVSRSSENLTDLALPAKMQRTISQEYLKSMNAGTSTTFTTFSFRNNPPSQPSAPICAPAPLPQAPSQVTSMHPAANSNNLQQQYQASQTIFPFNNSTTPMTQTNPNASDSVEVPATTKCAICNQTNVDTQLRPCGHMFHGKCLKPSIQNAVGAPRCPIDGTTMVSAVLAVSVDENAPSSNGTPTPGTPAPVPSTTPFNGGLQMQGTTSNQQEKSTVPGV